MLAVLWMRPTFTATATPTPVPVGVPPSECAEPVGGVAGTGRTRSTLPTVPVLALACARVSYSVALPALTRV